MTKCIVKGCSNTTQKNSGVTLHGFPSSLNAIKLWLQQTGNDFGDVDAFAKRILDSRSRWIYRMCSKHFSPQSYIWSGKKLILRPDAVPTIFPGKMNRYIMEDVLGFTRSESAQVEMQLQLDSITEQHGGHHPTSLCKCQTTGVPQRKKPENRSKEEMKPTPAPSNGKVMVDKSTNTDPMVGKEDKGTLWPEFEYNFDGEPWKIKHDHFYPHVRAVKEPKKRGRPSKRKDDFWCTNDYESIKNSLNHKHRYPLTDSPYIFIEKDYFDADMVPIKSGDVAVFFSREEWKYIEQHKENYQDMLPDEPPFSKFRIPESSGLDDSKDGMLITEDGLYTSLPVDDAPASPTEHIKEEIEEIRISDKGFQETKSECMDYPADEVKEETEAFSIKDRHLEQNLDYSSDDFFPEDRKRAYKQALSDEHAKAHCLMSEENSNENDTNNKKNPCVNASPANNVGEGDGKEDNRSDQDLEEGGVWPRQCKVCSIWFPNYFQLSLHLKTHAVKKLLKCPTCQKGYRYQSQLITHQKTHRIKQRVYTCPVCYVQYAQKCQFAAHMRIHPGEKPHMCDECGKCFAQKGTLVLHQMKHKGLNPYKCKQCGKQFENRSKLIKHLKFHRTEKNPTTS
ncbi:zinc finger protein 615 isoform X2 [Xenopus laevis]|uniref:Zinc finger protein 615 isoform X2 n=1 Tax=Xenopus laevis TaxID=8355 RepID=A0A8J0TU45_XENLA|nr:zinc finger protein 615 isoform X2 [Xenopus laevis]